MQCTSSAQRSIKGVERVPLLMSSAQAAKQARFQTETPLPTEGLDLRLLPSSSRLDDNGFGPRKSCAVVGASGSVLAARHGDIIDSHQHVLRINRVLTRGFEAHVGHRTTLNLFWGHRSHLHLWMRQQHVLPPAERARGLVVAVKAKDVSFFFEAAANFSRATAGSTAGSAPPAPLLLMSDRVYLKAVAHLCRATDNGREWPTDYPLMRPSSGMLAVVFALQACRNVSLFGLSTGDPCAPHHYFDEPPSPCTSAVPDRYNHPFHWFEREHEIYREWAETGRLTIHS